MNHFLNQLYIKNSSDNNFALVFGMLEDVHFSNLIEKGCKVTKVEKICDVPTFNIASDTYSLIIVNNIISFILDKAVVIKFLKRMSEGLIVGGKLYLNFLGKKDSWYGRNSINFYEPEEISGMLCGLRLHESKIEQGLDVTINGSIKYWDIRKQIYAKEI